MDYKINANQAVRLVAELSPAHGARSVSILPILPHRSLSKPVCFERVVTYLQTSPKTATSRTILPLQAKEKLGSRVRIEILRHHHITSVVFCYMCSITLGSFLRTGSWFLPLHSDLLGRLHFYTSLNDVASNPMSLLLTAYQTLQSQKIYYQLSLLRKICVVCISALMAPGISSPKHLPGLPCNRLTFHALSLSPTP